MDMTTDQEHVAEAERVIKRTWGDRLSSTEYQAVNWLLQDRKRRALTAAEAKQVDRMNRGECGHAPIETLLAIIDRIAVKPPEPQHRPCVCGRVVPARPRFYEPIGVEPKARVECECGRAGPWQPNYDAAWQAWDARP